MRGSIGLDLRVHRHVGFEFPSRIVDVDLDAVDKFHPFLFGLDLLGSEFGFGRDEGDAAWISFTGERIGGEAGGAAEFNTSEAAPVDISTHPRFIDVADSNDG